MARHPDDPRSGYKTGPPSREQALSLSAAVKRDAPIRLSRSPVSMGAVGFVLCPTKLPRWACRWTSGRLAVPGFQLESKAGLSKSLRLEPAH